MAFQWNNGRNIAKWLIAQEAAVSEFKLNRSAEAMREKHDLKPYCYLMHVCLQ